MDEYDGKIAPWREQLWATVAILSALAGVFLALVLLAGWYGDELEPRFICENDNCVEDRRPWIQLQALPIAAWVGCVLAFCVALPALRRERATRPAYRR